MIWSILSKIMILGFGFFIISNLNRVFKSDLIYNYIDYMFYFGIVVIILLEKLSPTEEQNNNKENNEVKKVVINNEMFKLTSEQKKKFEKLPITLNLTNSIEDKSFNIEKLNFDTENKKFFDKVKFLKNGYVEIENETGFVDLKKYQSKAEEIKHIVGSEFIKIKKHTNKSIIIDIFDRFPTNLEFCDRYLRKGEIFFGIDENGEENWIPIKSISNIGISGAAGAGKSVFQRQLINGLIYNLDFQDEEGKDYIDNIFLVDYKKVSYSQYKYIHPKIKVATGNEELFILSQEVYNLNQKRQKEIVDWNLNNPEKNDIDKIETNAIFYIYDEFAEYKDSCPDMKLDKEGYLNHGNCTTQLMSIVQTGRSQNIKTVICSQSLKTDVLEARIRSNLQSRVLLKSKDKESIIACLGSLEPIEELGNIDPIKFNYGRMVFLSDTPKGVKTLYLQSIFTDANFYKTIMKNKGWKRLTNNDLNNSNNSINLSKNDENDLIEDNHSNNDLEVLKGRLNGFNGNIELKKTEILTHEEIVKFRNELWNISKNIEGEHIKDLRSKLTKINTLIKSNSYDLEEIHNTLKEIEKRF